MTDFAAPEFCIGFDGEAAPVVWGVTPKRRGRPTKLTVVKAQPRVRDWRKDLSYKPSRSLRYSRSQSDIRAMENAYVDWLAKSRGWTTVEARRYCAEMDRRTIISVMHNTPVAIDENYRMAA